MYFKNFPKIFYGFDFNDGYSLRALQDITLNVRPLTRIIERATYYDMYTIQDNDTPEIIAERLYGDPNLHWILMLVNERYHYLNDWPISEDRFSDYVEAKYGVGQNNAIHMIYGRPHYVNEKGNLVDASYPLATPVTNEEYERKINDEKRLIKVVNPKLLDIFIKDLQEAFPK